MADSPPQISFPNLYLLKVGRSTIVLKFSFDKDSKYLSFVEVAVNFQFL